MKIKSVVLIVCLVGFLGGFAYRYLQNEPTVMEKAMSVQPEKSRNDESADSSGLHDFFSGGDSEKLYAIANWGDVHQTLEELYDSADLIVKARVTSSTNRLLSQTIPIQGLSGDVAKRAEKIPEHILILEKGMKERGLQGSPDQLTQEQITEILDTTTLEWEQIGENVVETPFTDAGIEVVELIKGNVEAEQQVVVLQLGGKMSPPNTPQNAKIDGQVVMEFRENPLLKMGSEYILFLKDSRHNTTHALGRQLYELVGPTGQFKINGKQLHNPMSQIENFDLPVNLGQLMQNLHAHKHKTDPAK